MSKKHGKRHGEHCSKGDMKKMNERRKMDKKKQKRARRMALRRRLEVEEKFGYHTYRQCTSKRWYQSLKGALDAADYMRGIFGVEYQPYKCVLCGGWHLTTHLDGGVDETVRGIGTVA